MTNHTAALEADPIPQRLMLWELAPQVARVLCERRDEAIGVQDGDLSPPAEWRPELESRRLEYIKRELALALELFVPSDLFVAATLLGAPSTSWEFEAWKNCTSDWQTQIARARKVRWREFEDEKRKMVEERATGIIAGHMADERKIKATEGIWLALRAAMMDLGTTVRATSDAGERRQLDRAELAEAVIDHVRNTLEVRGRLWCHVEVARRWDRVRSADATRLGPTAETASEANAEAPLPIAVARSDIADDPPLRKVKSKDTLLSQAKAALRRMFPDGKVSGSYAELSDRIEAKEGKRFEIDVIRRALDRKT